ncbi:putative PTS system mannose-specific, factor IIC [Reinekea sp. MED297]|uniref:Putative PTS system mannose-specific, factor IIC n=2 Tax=Reinekea TaxID=230494 RepID=A4BCP3_9GAMM|nr:putative PTS system mannose-specific, factor IIC [Reinekea sp. MED297] [Reinekea blandensis MED297]
MKVQHNPWIDMTALLKHLFGSLRDLLPIVLVILFFQFLVLRQPLPDVLDILIGTLLVVLGLTLFIQGLELGLFPIGESMAYAFANKGSLFWLLVFAFSLGFSTTVAEPALIAVAAEAAQVAGIGGMIENNTAARDSYAFGLRLTVAISVGIALVIGVLRILKGWPIHVIIIGGYVLVVLVTLIAPEEIIGIAYDSGGVTTSTITVPLVTALGIGLASAIKGRNPMIDGFGLIALASLTPMIFVMLYGIALNGGPA